MVRGVHKQKTRNPKWEVRIKWTQLGGVRSSGERRDSKFGVRNLMIRGECKSQSANSECEEWTRVFGECVFRKGLFGEMLVRKACSKKASSEVEEFGSVECSEFGVLMFKGIHVMWNAKCEMRVQNSEFIELRQFGVRSSEDWSAIPHSKVWTWNDVQSSEEGVRTKRILEDWK